MNRIVCLAHLTGYLQAAWRSEPAQEVLQCVDFAIPEHMHGLGIDLHDQLQQDAKWLPKQAAAGAFVAFQSLPSHSVTRG
jgi:hypothetical protein